MKSKTLSELLDEIRMEQEDEAKEALEKPEEYKKKKEAEKKEYMITLFKRKF